ncbi:hypothetical protein Syun_029699 [Stephania yunnanensis]|uniref:Uncharacterized protein n=1 Tax=Stephania yunnanensis TaxID=152371 RepID=A0AAP0E8G5_9MAGN
MLIKVNIRIQLVRRRIAVIMLIIGDFLLASPSSLWANVAIFHGLQSGHPIGVSE